MFSVFLQATSSNMLLHCVLRSTQPPPLSGIGSLLAVEQRCNVADWHGNLASLCFQQCYGQTVFSGQGEGEGEG